jgi:hypothetical protein
MRLAIVCLIFLTPAMAATETIVTWLDSEGNRHYRNFESVDSVVIPDDAYFYEIRDSKELPISTYSADPPPVTDGAAGLPAATVDRDHLPYRKLSPGD